MTRYRLAVLADPHGNLPALEGALAALSAIALDGLLGAGDYIGGPDDAAVLARLQALGARLVRGNGEDYIARIERGESPPEWHTHAQFAMVRWVYGRITISLRDELRALPEQLTIALPGADPILMFHGTPGNVNEHMHPGVNPGALERALDSTSAPVLICGHTHLPWQKQIDGRLAFSPGAICAPLNGEIGAQYGLLEWDGSRWSAEYHCTSYDLDEFLRRAEVTGLCATGPLARAHLISITHGGNWGDAFLRHARRLMDEKQLHSACIPDEIWAQAEATFDWDAPVLPLQYG